ncbi:hypothetical protein BN871_AX_00030 [Paenibacillus sp. P22]|nr:hypothetical protein BN871_AX_00030 [Paenibacillus sp. P22]
MGKTVHEQHSDCTIGIGPRTRESRATPPVGRSGGSSALLLVAFAAQIVEAELRALERGAGELLLLHDEILDACLLGNGEDAFEINDTAAHFRIAAAVPEVLQMDDRSASGISLHVFRRRLAAHMHPAEVEFHDHQIGRNLLQQNVDERLAVHQLEFEIMVVVAVHQACFLDLAGRALESRREAVYIGHCRAFRQRSPRSNNILQSDFLGEFNLLGQIGFDLVRFVEAQADVCGYRLDAGFLHRLFQVCRARVEISGEFHVLIAHFSYLADRSKEVLFRLVAERVQLQSDLRFCHRSKHRLFNWDSSSIALSIVHKLCPFLCRLFVILAQALWLRINAKPLSSPVARIHHSANPGKNIFVSDIRSAICPKRYPKRIHLCRGRSPPVYRT